MLMIQGGEGGRDGLSLITYCVSRTDPGASHLWPHGLSPQLGQYGALAPSTEDPQKGQFNGIGPI